MFFNKIKKINIKSLLADLIVVFIGVYLAFLLNNYNEKMKSENESVKLLTSLKIELEKIRVSFPGMAEYQHKRVGYYDSLVKVNKMINVSGYRFIQPQYNYAVLEYAINIKDSKIVNFDLFQQLLSLNDNLKQLAFAENLINQCALNFKKLPKNKDKSELYAFLEAENEKIFSQFIIYSRDRANILSRVSKRAWKTLEIINQEFKDDQRKEIEINFVTSYFEEYPSKFNPDRYENMIKNYFPNFTADDIQRTQQKIIDNE